MVADEITLQKVSISRIKQEMRDVYYLSDDLVIASFDIHRDTLGNYPALIDGFSAIIMASGSAVVAIDTEEYEVVPDTIVFFSPDRVIRTVASTSDAAAYFVACSKSFINEIQIDLSASLPVYMRFGKQPCLRGDTPGHARDPTGVPTHQDDSCQRQGALQTGDHPLPVHRSLLHHHRAEHARAEKHGQVGARRGDLRRVHGISPAIQQTGEERPVLCPPPQHHPPNTFRPFPRT